jgi:hypothetical protein
MSHFASNLCRITINYATFRALADLDQRFDRNHIDLQPILMIDFDFADVTDFDNDHPGSSYVRNEAVQGLTGSVRPGSTQARGD